LAQARLSPLHPIFLVEMVLLRWKVWDSVPQHFDEQLEAAFMGSRSPDVKWYTAFLCLCSTGVLIVETLLFQMGSSSGAMFDLMFRPMFAMVLFVAIVLVNFRPEVTSVCAFTALQFWCPLLTMNHSGGWAFSTFTDVKGLCTGFDQFPLVAMSVSTLSYLTLVPARVRYSWLVPAMMPVSYMLWTLPFRPECSASGYLRLSMTSVLLLIQAVLLIRSAVVREQFQRQIFESSYMTPQKASKDTQLQQVWIDNEELNPAPVSMRQVGSKIEYNYAADFELTSTSSDEEVTSRSNSSSSSQTHNQVELDVCRYVNRLVIMGETARMEQAHYKNTRNIVETMQLAKTKSKSKRASSSSPSTEASGHMNRASDQSAKHKMFDSDHALHPQSTHCMHRSTSEASPRDSLRHTSSGNRDSTQSTNSHGSDNSQISCASPLFPSSCSASSESFSKSEAKHPMDGRTHVYAYEHSFDGHWELAEEHPGMSAWVRRLMIYGTAVVDGEGKLRSMQRNAHGEIVLRSGVMHIEQEKLYRLGMSGVTWVYTYVGSVDRSLLQQNIQDVKC